MNVVSSDHLPCPPDPVTWDEPAMRAGLAARDVTRVYRLLQKLGYSQHRIAAMTGQSQPEVSAIIHGRRVMAYDVLSKIADGLGVPRGYMGLADTETPAAAEGPNAVAGPVALASRRRTGGVPVVLIGTIPPAA